MHELIDPVPDEALCKTMDEFECLRVAFCSPTGASSTHTIYCKAHRVRVNSDLTPNDRTLFTLGWPPYCNKTTIKELFSRAGHVTEVFLQAGPGAVQVENSRTLASLSQGQPQGFQVIKLNNDYGVCIYCSVITPPMYNNYMLCSGAP